jgi:hypothetical protein
MASDMSQTSVADRLARTATQIEAESAAAAQELEQLVRPARHSFSRVYARAHGTPRLTHHVYAANTL